MANKRSYVQDYLKLGFGFGVLLPDPDGLLEGAGKQVRYVMIRQPSDIHLGAIRELIIAAINLPAERETKLWLMKNQ
jgi:hypothetical protein